MAKPSDPRPPAIPSPSPDLHADDSWDAVDSDDLDEGPDGVIVDEAPPITHWDLVSEERISAVRIPSLPGGTVMPRSMPSEVAIPAMPPEPFDLDDEEFDDEDDEDAGDDEEFGDEDAEADEALDAPAGAAPLPPTPPALQQVEAELSDDSIAALSAVDVSRPRQPAVARPPSPPPDEDEEIAILEHLLAVPSAESMARLPSIPDEALPPADDEDTERRPPRLPAAPTPHVAFAAAPSSLEAREEALAEADDIAGTPEDSSDSLSVWVTPKKKAPPLPKDLSTRPIKRTPAVMFAAPPSGTGPAISFASPPSFDEGEAIPIPPAPATPLQDRVEEMVGRRVDLVIEPPEAQILGDAPFPLPDRYRWLSTLGEGGQGRVELVFDRDLGRQVALKTLHPSKGEERHLLEFYCEARITGQLEHPNIMPVYDAGQLPDGRLYYTMRRMPGENLHNVLSRLRRGDGETLRTWGLADLVRVLREAAMGVGYAHDHDVLHRDLKPANILLGGHGEVLVVDWGIARFAPREDGVGVTDSIRRRLWSESRDPRRERVRGSPPYMAPEQIKHPDQVSAAADVFCLGVILYEILTRFPPFTGEDVEAVVESLCHERPMSPRERAPELTVPPELEEICLRALEKFPGHRFRSATELADALGAWQSGARRKEAASRRLREADAMRSRYQVLVGRKRGAESQVRDTWGPVGRHRPEDGPAAELAMVSDQAASLGRAADGVFGEAVWALHQALREDPENPTARAQLAELYSDRFAEAERAGLQREAAYFRSLLRQFDQGRWDRWLRAGAEVRIEARPLTADLALVRIEERDGRFVLGEEVPASSPGTWSVSPGRYGVVSLDDPDGEVWHYPVIVRRNQRLDLTLDLRDAESAGERFCFIPGGHAILGGDRDAPGSAPEHEVDIPSFAIARNPVSVGAYARFLGWLQREEPAEVRARTPENWTHQTRRGESRPVTGLSLADARRYCRWLTELTGVVIRLPRSDEWEKAVRGTDGRAWPWGNRFLPQGAATLHSCEPGDALPLPGSFPLDRSPFGVEDGAGLVWEWTDSGDEALQIVRGGSVLDTEFGSRAATRRALRPDRRLPTLGFRVLRELGD